MIVTSKSILSLILLSSLSLACRESTEDASRSVLSGDWVSACFPYTSLHPSSLVAYRFDDEHGVVRSQNLYTDADCQNLAGSLIHSGEYSLEVRPEISVFNIDIFFNKVSAAPDTELALELWANQKFCGREDWQMKTVLDLTGSSEEGCMTYGNVKVEYRDLVQVDAKNQIIFAASLSPLIPRPSAIEPGRVDRIFRARHL